MGISSDLKSEFTRLAKEIEQFANEFERLANEIESHLSTMTTEQTADLFRTTVRPLSGTIDDADRSRYRHEHGTCFDRGIQSAGRVSDHVGLLSRLSVSPCPKQAGTVLSG
jgi:hypothetical protein